MIDLILSTSLSIAPVLLFLWGLIYLDTYKLVPMRAVLWSIVAGCVSAGVAVTINRGILTYTDISLKTYVHVGAPIIEEICKAAWPLFLLRSKRIGFMVDGGVHGFSAGAGFAVIENIVYMETIGTASPIVWVVRGFGTALMHGGTTAIIVMMAKNRADIRGKDRLGTIVPALLTGIVLHAGFNQFFFSPLMSTLLIALALPPIMVLVFQRSEQATRTWLGVGFDTDADLLAMVTSGNIADTPVGKYLQSLRERFQPEVVVDLVCYLRIYLELAVQAKGLLLMRDAGFDIPPAPDTQSKFKEMDFLNDSIGRTGKLALSPLLRMSNRELWQMHMLKETVISRKS